MKWQLDDVRVLYENEGGPPTEALCGLSLAIRQSERLAVVGANGSGKSTLALCLAGLIRPTSGCVAVGEDGEELGVSPYGAIVFQAPDDNLICETPLAEMALTLEHTSTEPGGTDALAELTRLGLGDLAHRPVETLSGGEKQKLAVACALASARPLIILDEPTSHLDPPGRRELFGYLREIQKEEECMSPALILVTQYEEEARHFERVLHLQAGSIVYDGPSTSWAGLRPLPGPAPIPRAKRHEGAAVLVRADGMSQIESPGWPLPKNPLCDINVEVRAGDAIGLCGPIGAGKTTLACHLAALCDRWKGSLVWPQASAVAMPPALLIQFPERQLFCPTVFEDVCYGPIAAGMDRGHAERTGSAVLTRLGLPPEEFGNRSPFSLSGGQKRRAAMAGIAAMSTRLYLLDEPSAALDPQGVDCLQALCTTWLESGCAYIIISHDLELLRRLTERVWVMDRGRIVHDGTWRDLDSHPDVLTVIGFRDAGSTSPAKAMDLT